MMKRSRILHAGKNLLFAIVCFIFLQNILFAKPDFPTLSGRVVDKAQILSQNEEKALTYLLEKHEKETSNQIVILTLKTLDSYDIADYAYQLGRHWGIGQKNKNNGVLLIVSMKEKKLRIEVGYGLEGALPDKTAHEIIEYILKPNFKKANFYKGIDEATNAIIKAIKGEYKPSDYGVLSSSSENFFFVYFAIIFLSGVVGIFVRKLKNNTISKVLHSSMLGGFGGAFAIGFFNSFSISIIVFLIIAIIVFLNTKEVLYSNSSKNTKASSKANGFGGGFSSNSTFSGGGGSFGGGGASGGW